MTTTLSSFETAIIATGPMYFLRATDDSIMLLPNIINCPLEFQGVDGGAGAMLVPGDGIMGKPSKRFTGDANPGYIRQQLDSSLNTGKITVVAVIGKVRNPPGAPGVPDSITAIVSRQQVGGWTLDCRKNGINFYIYIGGNYRSAFFDHNLLSESGNLVHASFDGRYYKIS